jgi:hypothetical protein
MTDGQEQERAELRLCPIDVIYCVAEPWAAVGQEIRRPVSPDHNDADIDVSALDRSHQMGQVVRQQVAAGGYLELNPHADFGSVVNDAFGPVDPSQFDLLPLGEDRPESKIEHFSHRRGAVRLS